MIHGYISGHLYRSLLGLNRFGYELMTVAGTFSELFLNTMEVVQLCSPERACECNSTRCSSAHHFIPCGSISERYSGDFQGYSKITVPRWFYVNITVLYLESHRYGVDCFLSETLKFSYRNPTHAEMLCGNQPLQNYYLMTSSLRVMWFSKDHAYDTKPAYCLVYQAMAQKHVLVAPKLDAWDIYTENACEHYPEECFDAKHFITGPSFNGLYAYGNLWVFTWHVSGEVLKTPTVTLNTLSCGIQPTEKPSDAFRSHIQVIDGPFSPHDQHFLANLFSRIVDHSCDIPMKKRRFSGSNGDITVQVMWYNQQKFKVTIIFSFTDLECQTSATLCSLQKVNITKPEIISGTSPNHTSQTRFLISLTNPNDGFIGFLTMTFHYDGLGHLPCITGGIFIYELGKRPSLVARICTLWASAVWSSNNKEGSVDKIHFSNRPILLVIKSYRNTGTGSFHGRVQLSKCEGLLNPLPITRRFKFIYNRTKMRTSRTYSASIADIDYYKNCVVIQEVLLDQFVAWEDINVYKIRFRKARKNTKLGCLQLPRAYLSGCFDLPKKVNTNVDLWMAKKPVKCPDLKLVFGKDHKYATTFMTSKPMILERGCFEYDQAPTAEEWSLEINTACLLYGLKLTVVFQGERRNNLDCRDPRLIQKWLSSQSFQGENVAVVPPVPCGDMLLSAETHTYEVIFLQMFASTGLCCYLKVSIQATPAFFDKVVQYIDLFEMPGAACNTVKGRAMLDIIYRSYGWTYEKFPTTWSSNSSRINSHGSNGIHISLTSNNMVFETHAEIAIDRRSEANDHSFNLSFHYLSLLDDPVQSAFASLTLRNKFCVDAVRTCYKAVELEESSWSTATEACEDMGLTLFTVNTEVEWNLLQHWFVRDVASMATLRKVLLVFLGLKFGTVGRYFINQRRHSCHVILPHIFLVFLYFARLGPVYTKDMRHVLKLHTITNFLLGW